MLAGLGVRPRLEKHASLVAGGELVQQLTRVVTRVHGNLVHDAREERCVLDQLERGRKTGARRSGLSRVTQATETRTLRLPLQSLVGGMNAEERPADNTSRRRVGVNTPVAS